jgi:hypothetical protein
MIILLSIIAFIVAILTGTYYLHISVKEKYFYSVISIGSMAISFLGAVAFVLGYKHYIDEQIMIASILFVIGISSYIIMFVIDSTNSTITVAITALILRFTISAILILIILWYAFGKRSSMDGIKDSLKNIERKL